MTAQEWVAEKRPKYEVDNRGKVYRNGKFEPQDFIAHSIEDAARKLGYYDPLVNKEAESAFRTDEQRSTSGSL